MKNLVIFLLLVCTFHGTCVSLKCYTCNFFDDGCDVVSMSAPPDVETCPVGSVCKATKYIAPVGGVVKFTRGCETTFDCKNGCSPYLMVGTKCTTCCNEDHCNNGVPIGGDISCYTCSYLPQVPGGDSSACDDPFDPHDQTVQTTTCSSGQCAIHAYTGLSRRVYRGCPTTQLPCRLEPYCLEDGMCIDCCSEKFCNGRSIVLPVSTATQRSTVPPNYTTPQLSTVPPLSTVSLLSTINSTSKAPTKSVAKVAPKGLTGPAAVRAPTTSLTDQDETGKGTCLSKHSFDVLILSVTGILLKWFINY